MYGDEVVSKLPDLWGLLVRGLQIVCFGMGGLVFLPLQLGGNNLLVLLVYQNLYLEHN